MGRKVYMVGTIKDHRKRQNIQNSSCRFEHFGVISMVYKRFVFYSNMYRFSLGNQPTFRDGTTGLPAKWRLTNDFRNSILTTCHYPDLDSAFDWSCHKTNLSQAIRRAIQILVVTRHEWRIPEGVPQTSFRGEISGGVAKCRLFSQASTGFKVYFCWRFLKIAREKETEKQIAPSRHFHDLNSHRTYLSTYQRARNCSVIVKRRYM